MSGDLVRDMSALQLKPWGGFAVEMNRQRGWVSTKTIVLYVSAGWSISKIAKSCFVSEAAIRAALAFEAKR